ncbi:hypothetical protein Y1Q_0008433 [Alligator mississippiensis]|uniref:Uncharacterized protein n=1 Tax=Alligator mississippiensis TaxID=8496 RepID=A0A151NK43_ALLMI|nr:hypothetical protein Y1Q_0008433 [Alligator mississippiensis]
METALLIPLPPGPCVTPFVTSRLTSPGSICAGRAGPAGTDPSAGTEYRRSMEHLEPGPRPRPAAGAPWPPAEPRPREPS